MIATADPSIGVIEPGRLYVATEARRRLKLGDKGWRDLLRAGLKVVRVGNNRYVTGDDLLEVFSKLEVTRA